MQLPWAPERTVHSQSGKHRGVAHGKVRSKQVVEFFHAGFGGGEAGVRRGEDIDDFLAQFFVQAPTLGDARVVLEIDGYQLVERAFLQRHGEVVDWFEGAPFMRFCVCPREVGEGCDGAKAFKTGEGLRRISDGRLASGGERGVRSLRGDASAHSDDRKEGG